jgi:hypothetical protein
MKLMILTFFTGLMALASPVSAQEPPLEYVRVCDVFGTGFYYIPGTETCVRDTDGQTRQDTEFGVVTSETALASRVGALEADAAIATALEDPDLVAGEHFGVRVNWGAAGAENAAGVTGSAVLGENLFGESGRITGSGGVGFTNGRVGGRAGLQLTW